MKKLLKFCLLLLFCSLLACSTDSKDSNSGNSACSALSLKIYNGDVCSRRGPVVKIQSTVTDLLTNQKRTSLCSGIVIGKRHVLTAAHCVISNNAYEQHENFTVETETELFTQESINQLYYPHSYFESTYHFDMAVFELNHDIVGIDPIAFLSSSNVTAGEILTVFGYGVSENGQNGQLKAGKVEATSNSDEYLIHCSEVKSSEIIQAPCGGDSGGPLIAERNGEPFLVGIVSRGSTELVQDGSCGASNYYTNLQFKKYLDMISKLVPDIVIK